MISGKNTVCLGAFMIVFRMSPSLLLLRVPPLRMCILNAPPHG